MHDERVPDAEPDDEAACGAVRLERWITGRAQRAELSRIVKPLPADEFRVYGSNAEMRWEVMRDYGFAIMFDERSSFRTDVAHASGTGSRGPWVGR